MRKLDSNQRPLALSETFDRDEDEGSFSSPLRGTRSNPVPAGTYLSATGHVETPPDESGGGVRLKIVEVEPEFPG